jgi:hypothetical protein
LRELKKLRLRLEALESRVTDGSGLVPHSPEWLEYWMDQCRRLAQNPRDSGAKMPIEAYRALVALAEQTENSRRGKPQRFFRRNLVP